MAQSAAINCSTNWLPATIMHRSTNFAAGIVVAAINTVIIGILSSLLVYWQHSNLSPVAASAVIETETSSFALVFS